MSLGEEVSDFHVVLCLLKVLCLSYFHLASGHQTFRTEAGKEHLTDGTRFISFRSGDA